MAKIDAAASIAGTVIVDVAVPEAPAEANRLLAPRVGSRVRNVVSFAGRCLQWPTGVASHVVELISDSDPWKTKQARIGYAGIQPILRRIDVVINRKNRFVERIEAEVYGIRPRRTGICRPTHAEDLCDGTGRRQPFRPQRNCVLLTLGSISVDVPRRQDIVLVHDVVSFGYEIVARLWFTKSKLIAAGSLWDIVKPGFG